MLQVASTLLRPFLDLIARFLVMSEPGPCGIGNTHTQIYIYKYIETMYTVYKRAANDSSCSLCQKWK